jgi:hypothetical protein
MFFQSYRPYIIKFHLLLTSFFIPFLIILPLTGTLYLLNIKGTVEKTSAFHIVQILPTESKELETFFRQEFKDRNIDYPFETIKIALPELIFRPTTKNYYQAKINPQGAEVFFVKPNWQTKLMELHKGHGPKVAKKWSVVFGVGFFLILISGFILALTQSSEGKWILIPSVIGSLILFFLVS